MTNDQGSVENLLSELRAARMAGDVDTLASHFADDATFRIAGAGDTISGRDAIREALAGLVGEFQFLEWHPVNVFVSENDLSVRSHVKIRHRSGRVIDTEISDFATLRDGKLASYVQFIDTALLLELRNL